MPWIQGQKTAVSEVTTAPTQRRVVVAEYASREPTASEASLAPGVQQTYGLPHDISIARADAPTRG